MSFLEPFHSLLCVFLLLDFGGKIFGGHVSLIHEGKLFNGMEKIHALVEAVEAQRGCAPESLGGTLGSVLKALSPQWLAGSDPWLDYLLHMTHNVAKWFSLFFFFWCIVYQPSVSFLFC